MPTLAAGIRGTGGNRVTSEAQHHQSFSTQPQGAALAPANAINHTDEELDFLAQLINQRTAWQIFLGARV